MAASKSLFLSASRIDAFADCSQKYSAKYHFKIPDPGNDGSKRGSTVHEVLELLLVPRHQKHYRAALAAKTCTSIPALWRLVVRFARRFGVADSENLKLIDGFIMVALKHDFLGLDAGTPTEVLGEKDFVIQKDDGVNRYNVRGFIDKTFLYNDVTGWRANVLDYKTSAKRMDPAKQAFNLQSQIYQLALRHLYPHITQREFAFLELKFKTSPLAKQPSFSDEELNGFEGYLTDIQTQMEAFTLAQAGDNLAAGVDERQWLCGREGLKKDGTPAWICPARNPLDYWVVRDANGEIVRSAFTELELGDVSAGQWVDTMRYSGCPAHWSPSGKRRNYA